MLCIDHKAARIRSVQQPAQACRASTCRLFLAVYLVLFTGQACVSVCSRFRGRRARDAATPLLSAPGGYQHLRLAAPRPPPGALPAAIGICAARHARCAAAHPAATTRRAASRVGASGCGRICHAAAEARAAARESTPLPTTAAPHGDPRLHPHLSFTARRTRRRLT